MCREKGIEIIDGKCSRTHLETKEFKAKADADFVDRMAGELLCEQDRFKEYVIGSDSAVSYLEHIENEELRKTVSKQDEILKRQKEMLSACWDEFSEQNQSCFDYYRKQKKRISDEVGRLRNETNDSRQYLNELLCDLVFSNDLLIVRLIVHCTAGRAFILVLFEQMRMLCPMCLAQFHHLKDSSSRSANFDSCQHRGT